VTAMSRKSKAAAAELLLAALLIGYGAFSFYNLGLLILLASQSLWVRELGWADLGLGRKRISGRAVLAAVVAAAAVLISVRTVIAPVAMWVTSQPIDLSGVITPGDRDALLIRLAQAWTLAAFGEEMVFRGYLIRTGSSLSRMGRCGRYEHDRSHVGSGLPVQPEEPVGGHHLSRDRGYCCFRGPIPRPRLPTVAGLASATMPRRVRPPNKALHLTKRVGVPATRAIVEARFAGERRC
jgi:hypothetical protein